MRAGEPDLAELFVLDEALLGRVGLDDRNIALVPQLGVKGGALLVERQRLAGARHPVAEKGVGGKLERPDVAADAAGHLVERRAIGGDGVPHADEMDLLHAPIVGLVVFVPQDQIADTAEEILNTPDGVVALAPVLAIGGARFLVELLLILRGDEPLVENEASNDTDGEGAAAEAEAEQAIAVFAIV